MKKNNALCHFLFALYLAVLVYFLFFAEGFREAASGAYRYNFIPFHEIRRYLLYADRIGYFRTVVNLAGNIVAFMPLGFFLPKLAKRNLNFWMVTLYSMEASIAVEVLQLFTKVVCCDVDDVILNTTGGMLGFLCYYICKGRKKR